MVIAPKHVGAVLMSILMWGKGKGQVTPLQARCGPEGG
jgi:hypothetical protein